MADRRHDVRVFSTVRDILLGGGRLTPDNLRDPAG